MFERDKIQEAIERLKKVTGKSMALPSVLDIAHAFMGNDSWTVPYLRDALVELLETARDSIPLPKDADGETIHVGDVMVNPSEYKFETYGVGWCGDVALIFCNEPDDDTYTVYVASACRHYREPSIKDMLVEFQMKSCKAYSSHSSGEGGDSMTTLVNEYVEKIRALQDGSPVA